MTAFAQAWRALVRRRLFTLTTVGTLALGIAVTTTVFSVVHGVLLRPLPFPDPGQLVALYEASPGRAAAALVLAALGLYGLLSLLVAQQRRELGVRMALGASPRDLVRVVVFGAGRLLAGGIAMGCVLLPAAGFLLRALLFGVTPYDPRALAWSVGALALVSLVAMIIPARQAAGVSAMEAMKNG